jgi:hypothetical protein
MVYAVLGLRSVSVLVSGDRNYIDQVLSEDGDKIQSLKRVF